MYLQRFLKDEIPEVLWDFSPEWIFRFSEMAGAFQAVQKQNINGGELQDFSVLRL